MADMLKIRLRPVKGEQLELEMPAGDTVDNLKQRIMEVRPEFTSQMKIICTGKILEDSMKLQDVGIKPNFPLVIMASKKRPSEFAEQPAAAEQEAAAATTEAPQADVAAQSGSAPEAPAHAHEGPPEVEMDFGALVQQPPEAVQQLCEMGFDRGDVERCLHLAFGNPDRAAEYLMSGIPPDVQDPAQAEGQLNTGSHSLMEDFEAIADLDSTQRGALMRDSVENAGLGINPVEAMINAARSAFTPQSRLQGEWQVQTESGWQPWQPGVPFQGQAGEVVNFSLGRQLYRATFQDGSSGVQINVQTGRERPLRRRGANPDPPQVLVPGVCGRDQLPSLLAHEVEFEVSACSNFTAGQPVRSESRTVADFRFRLLVFPHGTASTGGNFLSAFVEADPQEDLDAKWAVENVKYQITLINWIDYRASVTKVDTWTFHKDGIDRGWHDMVKFEELTAEKGWLGPNGSVLLRASCYCAHPRSLRLGPDYCSQKELGIPSWEVHEALPTSLLQSLSQVNGFRSLVSASQPDPAKFIQGSSLLMLLRDLIRADDAGASEVRICNPQPVLQALEWHGLDSWGGKGPGELLADLCVGLERSDFKKVFQIQVENYIECCDVDFKSVRQEPCYAFKLPLCSPCGRSLNGVMDSFRQVLAEELLEGENSYEAEGHGKQRARKGVRISCLPPVLLLDIGRFSFDMASMQQTFLETRFEFPTELSLREFCADSGSYRLHTVLSHDTESGSYNAHVRPSSQSNWVKYTDDGRVVSCSEYSAVMSKYGGGQLKVWNYFDKTPETLRTASCPTKAHKELACTLIYVCDAD